MSRLGGSGRRGSGRWAAFFAIAWLGVQVGVPAVQLFREKPVQFGWQMFSANRGIPPVFAVYADTTVRVEATELLLHDRRDVDFRSHVVRHLCRTTEARAVEVGFIPARGDTVTVHPCE